MCHSWSWDLKLRAVSWSRELELRAEADVSELEPRAGVVPVRMLPVYPLPELLPSM